MKKEVEKEMLHTDKRMIVSKSLYFYRAQTHEFVANGTRMPNFSN